MRETTPTNTLALVEFALSIVRIALGLVLAAAGVAKLRSASRFSVAIGAYRLLPARAVPVAAGVIPLAEIACGGWLLSGYAVVPAAIASSVLLALFTGAVGVALRRGQRNECGCGLPGASRIGVTVVMRNVGLITALLVLAVPNILGGGR